MMGKRRLRLPFRILIAIIVMFISIYAISFAYGWGFIFIFNLYTIPVIVILGIIIGMILWRVGIFWDIGPGWRVLGIMGVMILELALAELWFLTATYDGSQGAFRLCMDSCGYHSLAETILMSINGFAIVAFTINASIACGWAIKNHWDKKFRI